MLSAILQPRASSPKFNTTPTICTPASTDSDGIEQNPPELELKRSWPNARRLKQIEAKRTVGRNDRFGTDQAGKRPVVGLEQHAHVNVVVHKRAAVLIAKLNLRRRGRRPHRKHITHAKSADRKSDIFKRQPQGNRHPLIGGKRDRAAKLVRRWVVGGSWRRVPH